MWPLAADKRWMGWRCSGTPSEEGGRVWLWLWLRLWLWLWLWLCESVRV